MSYSNSEAAKDESPQCRGPMLAIPCALSDLSSLTDCVVPVSIRSVRIYEICKGLVLAFCYL